MNQYVKKSKETYRLAVDQNKSREKVIKLGDMSIQNDGSKLLSNKGDISNHVSNKGDKSKQIFNRSDGPK